MHSSPELSRELPVVHKHTKDPWLFLQSPLTQGLDLHSFTSVGEERKSTSVWPFVITLTDTAHAVLKWHCTAQPHERVSDPRRRPSPSRSGILWDTDRWNCLACSCTARCHRAVGSSGIHQYLRRKHTKRWLPCRLILTLYLQYRAIHPPTQFLPVRSTSKPSLQVHLYVLSMFSHTPFWQISGSRAHSLISEKVKNSVLNIRL